MLIPSDSYLFAHYNSPYLEHLSDSLPPGGIVRPHKVVGFLLSDDVVAQVKRRHGVVRRQSLRLTTRGQRSGSRVHFSTNQSCTSRVLQGKPTSNVQQGLEIIPR